MTPKIPLYGDVQNRALTNSDGSTLTLPSLTLGDKLLFSLHALSRDSDKSVTIADLNLRTLRASIGQVMTSPDGGTFTLRAAAGSESAALPPKATVAAVKSALQELPECSTAGAYPIADVRPGTNDGCWILRFDCDGEVPLVAANNKLTPVAFVRVRAFQDNGIWWHELRLIAAPLVFTDTFERVLADAPSISRIREGAYPTDTDSTSGYNEIQAITVPPEFVGTYYVQFGAKTSTILGNQSTVSDITSALNAMYADGSTNFSATNPLDNMVYVEFVGALAKAPQKLLTVSVQTFTKGEIRFFLNLNNARLAEALRDNDSVTLPFEVEAEIVDNAEDIIDPTVPGRIITLFSSSVTIVREQIFEELATVPEIDWENPPQPKDYIPYTRDQIFSGLQNYIVTLGDGVTKTFVVNHNLGTDVMAVSIRQNTSGGRLLSPSEYAVSFATNNQATITFPGAPTTDSLILLLVSPFTVNVFQAHHHSIAQIDGLEDRLTDLENRVTVLEGYLPKSTVTSSSSSDNSLSISIPATAEVLFYNPAKLDLKALPVRPPALLPAISAEATTDLPSPLPSPASNSIWTSTAGQLIPSFGRIPEKWVKAAGFVGSDERMLYPVTQGGSSKTYYPTAFERTLFEFQIDEMQLLAGKKLVVNFGVALQLLKANCEAQWVLVIEHGVPNDLTTPPTQGQNLQSITWADTPLLKQRIYVTPLLMTHAFGCQIMRSATEITANQIRYGATSVTDSAPAGPNFILRARLINFDTRNNVHHAEGWLYCAMGKNTDVTADATASIS